MTQDEIIEMAKQAGMDYLQYISPEAFEKVTAFCKLVAQHEREACAKIADKYANGLERNYSEIIADEIKARGQA
jgi:hypothetical protein